MATKTRIYHPSAIADALAQEPPDMPLPGLVDLRHKGPLLDKTQVLDEAELRRLRSEYEAMRGPIVREPRDGELTDRTVRAAGLKRPPRFRLIGALLAILVALVSGSVCRSWMAGRHVARAAIPSALPVAVDAPVVAATERERPSRPAAATLPRAALDALATGDRTLALRAYTELAWHELEPGPYSAAAAILARELKAAE